MSGDHTRAMGLMKSHSDSPADLLIPRHHLLSAVASRQRRGCRPNMDLQRSKTEGSLSVASTNRGANVFLSRL